MKSNRLKNLDDLDTLLEILKGLKKYEDKSKENFTNILKKALYSPCEISIIKNKKGQADIHMEGKGLSILILLAALEKEILTELNCSEDRFDILKKFVDSKDL